MKTSQVIPIKKHLQKTQNYVDLLQQRKNQRHNRDPKDKCEQLEKSVNYEIKCDGCNAVSQI
jgi:hypothetical protein